MAERQPSARGGGAGPASTTRPVVVIVGGGITGLSAAWELTGGDAGPCPDSPTVVVLEADTRLGGKLRSAAFAGTMIDVGPDGFLGRRPEAAQLCRVLGLADRLVPIGAAGASVWARGEARPLPSNLALGVPTRFLPVARSGILGIGGSARLLLDVVAPRPDRRGPLGDRAVGPLVARRLGHRVVDRLVDPMLGGIYGGGVGDASAAAVFPLLLNAAARRGSFMRSLRAASGERPPSPGPETPSSGTPSSGTPSSGTSSSGASRPDAGVAQDPTSQAVAPPEPAFWALAGGLEVLVDRLADALAQRGVAVRVGTPVEALSHGTGERAWAALTATGPVEADGVVLAVPAGPAAALLTPHDVEAANLLRSVEYSSVAVVTLALPPGTVPERLPGTGILVPARTRVPAALADELATAGVADGEGDGAFLVTACTFLSRKWPHLANRDTELVRASVGRFGDPRPGSFDDGRLTMRVAAEVGTLLGAPGGVVAPIGALVTRWPEALPQYRVHHLLRVAGVEAALERLGAVAVAGAASRGVGIPACIASGRLAARNVARRLGVAAGAG